MILFIKYVKGSPHISIGIQFFSLFLLAREKKKKIVSFMTALKSGGYFFIFIILKFNSELTPPNPQETQTKSNDSPPKSSAESKLQNAYSTIRGPTTKDLKFGIIS